MPDLNDLIAPEAVLADIAVPNVRALFVAVGTGATELWGLGSRQVADGLGERERLGTTGFGGGVALPHAKFAGLDQVRGLFVRLTRPIDFGAVDELPVDLVLALLSPPAAGADHLKALASVSRRLRNRPLADKLRGAGSRDAIYALLTSGDARDAG